VKIILVVLFQFLILSFFSQERINHSYKFKIQGVASYAQAKPYYDNIRLIFSESKSVNHLLFFDPIDNTFKTTSSIFFNKESLSKELEKIGLGLSNFITDEEVQE